MTRVSKTVSRLHVFDMDGTLLPGTTACRVIAEHIQESAQFDRLEKLWNSGRVTTLSFAKQSYTLWRTLRQDIVDEAFRSCTHIRGISEVMADIKRRRERAMLITMSPGFFARLYGGYGVEEIVASNFPSLPFIDTPLDTAGILTPEDKPRIVSSRCQDLGIQMKNVVAYGDSRSDVPLFRQVGLAVSVNGDETVSEVAHITYRGDDLRIAYRMAREKLVIE